MNQQQPQKRQRQPSNSHDSGNSTRHDGDLMQELLFLDDDDDITGIMHPTIRGRVTDDLLQMHRDFTEHPDGTSDYAQLSSPASWKYRKFSFDQTASMASPIQGHDGPQHFSAPNSRRPSILKQSTIPLQQQQQQQSMDTTAAAMMMTMMTHDGNVDDAASNRWQFGPAISRPSTADNTASKQSAPAVEMPVFEPPAPVVVNRPRSVIDTFRDPRQHSHQPPVAPVLLQVPQQATRRNTTGSTDQTPHSAPIAAEIPMQIDYFTAGGHASSSLPMQPNRPIAVAPNLDQFHQQQQQQEQQRQMLHQTTDAERIQLHLLQQKAHQQQQHLFSLQRHLLANRSHHAGTAPTPDTTPDSGTPIIVENALPRQRPQQPEEQHQTQLNETRTDENRAPAAPAKRQKRTRVLTAEQIQRRERRLERNRLAARECRKKKKEYLTDLENGIRSLAEENAQLWSEVTQLRQVALINQPDMPQPVIQQRLIDRDETIRNLLDEVEAKYQFQLQYMPGNRRLESQDEEDDDDDLEA